MVAPSQVSSSSSLAPGGLCTLTVSEPILEKDLLLQVVVKCASSILQVSVLKPSKGSNDTLSLSVGHSTVLKQRVSILRALVGPALFYALDSPLLSGHHHESTIAMASLQAWLSQTDVGEGLLNDLDRHFENNAFLLPSAASTLADYHIATLVLQQKQQEELQVIMSTYPNLSRWLRACHSQLLAILGPDSAKTRLLSLPDDTPKVLPIFYNGTEDANKILSAITKSSSNKPQQAQATQIDMKIKDQGGKTAGNKKQQQQQQQQQKGAKKKQGQQQQPAPAPVTISAIDLRVGQISKVWHHEEADKLFCEEINLGDVIGTRQVASGLREHYKLEDLQDRKVVVLCNLKKRNLVGFPSHGMVLCALNSDRTQVQLITPPKGANVGNKISFVGYEDGQPEPENKVAKKKIWEHLAPDLKTNDKGQVIWKGALSKTSPSGESAIGMPNAQVS